MQMRNTRSISGAYQRFRRQRYNSKLLSLIRRQDVDKLSVSFWRNWQKKILRLLLKTDDETEQTLIPEWENCI